MSFKLKNASEFKVRKAQGGFTLVELLVVVAIIGILAAIAIPQFMTFISKSKRAEMFVGLGGIFMVEKAYWASDNTYAQGSNDCSGAPATWDSYFSIGGHFNLSQPARYYKFCAIVSQNAFTGWGAGDLDNDPTIDRGFVTDLDRVPVLIDDDVIN